MSRVVDLTVRSMYGQRKLTLRSVHSKYRLPTMMDNAGTTADAYMWPHFSCLSIPRARTDYVALLTGQDNSEASALLSTILGRRNEPYAFKTPLGWTLHGILKDKQEVNTAQAYFVSATDTVHQDMEITWQVMPTARLKQCQYRINVLYGCRMKVSSKSTDITSCPYILYTLSHAFQPTSIWLNTGWHFWVVG